MSFHLPLDYREDRQDDEIPDGRDHQQWNDFQIAVEDDLDSVEELGNGDDVDVGRALRHADDVVERHRQDGAHRLGQDNAKGLAKTR